MEEASASFPTNPAEFDQDERISYSRLDNKYIAVHDDGTEFEFNPQQKTWSIIEEEDDAVADDAVLVENVARQESIDRLDGDSRKRKDGPGRDDEVS